MAKVKKKRKSVKGQDGWLENFLRFEIIIALFSLIGVYYFLSFSPIRMPQEPITSPRAKLAILSPSVNSDELVSAGKEQPLATRPTSAGIEAEVAAGLSVNPDPGKDSALPSAPVVAPAVFERKPASKLAGAGPALDGNGKTNSQKIVESQPLELEKSAVLSAVDKLNVSPSPIVASTPMSTATVAASATVEQVLEIGSYVLSKELLRARSQLEALGLLVKSEVKKIPTPMYRVFLGPFSDRQKTRKMMAMVRKMGDQPFTQKLKNGSIVVIGSFYLKDSVLAWENMYQEAGFAPKVKLESLLIPHTKLLLDGPQVNNNPQELLARVKAAGFSDARLKTISSTNAE